MSLKIFEHEPLDLSKAAIRLIRVLPSLSPEGYIQCELSHGTLDDEYTCLSYVWGRESSTKTVLIHGKAFLVRRNLHNYLQLARIKYHSRPLWIDAMCIDQTNVGERNHQVSQMGAIYSAAKDVLVWLGMNLPLTAFFKVWRDCYRSESGPSWWLDTREALLRVEAGWTLFVSHEYWTRAWITQELAAARSLTFLAGSYELDTRLLRFILKIPWYKTDVIDARCKLHLDIACGRQRLRGRSLFTLLRELPKQHCKLTRDRVYSLAWLAIEGPRIQVDYEIPDRVFMHRLYQVCFDVWCACSYQLLVRVLGLWEHRRDSATTAIPEDILPLQINMQPCVADPWEELVLTGYRVAQRCGDCRDDWALPNIHGPIFCLAKVCPSLQGHLYHGRPSYNGGRDVQYSTGHNQGTIAASGVNWERLPPNITPKAAHQPDTFRLQLTAPFLSSGSATPYLVVDGWIEPYPYALKLCERAVRSGEIYWHPSSVFLQVKGDDKIEESPGEQSRPYLILPDYARCTSGKEKFQY